MAHIFDTNLRFSGATNPLTSNYTAGTGATVLVLGIVTAGSPVRSGSAPTFNGNELIQADQTRQHGTNPEMSCELWYLLAPETGSAIEISIPNPTSLVLHVQISTYKADSGSGSGKISILDVEGGASGTSASPNVSVTPTEDGAVVVGVFGDGEDFTPTGNTGTELNTTDDGLYSDNNQFTLQSTAGPINTGWTTQTYGAGVYGGGVYNGDDDWCMCVAAFIDAIISATVEPVVQTLSINILNPSIKIDDDVSVIVNSLNLTTALSVPIISLSESHEGVVQSLTLASPAPTVVITSTVQPSVLQITSSLTVNSIEIEFDVTVGVTVLNMALAVGQHNTLAPLDTVRMMPFIFSSKIAYPIEFGNKYARFYFDGNPLLGDNEVHVELATPYQPSDLLQLQTAQSADVMWITHPSHPPAKLSRTTPTTFTLEDIVFDKGPFIKRNDLANNDGVTMNVNATGAGEAGTLASSSGIFKVKHIGALFELTHPRVNRQANGTKNGTDVGTITGAIEVFGDFTFSITTSSWQGTVKLQRSTNDFATSTDVVIFTSGKQTFSSTEITEDVKYRTVVSSHAFGRISASLLVNTNSVQGSATSIGVIKTPLDIKGSFNFNTQGNWDATIVLERNENESGWEPFRTYLSKIVDEVGSRNVQFEGIEEEDNVRYRMNVTSYIGGTVEADLSATSSTQSGIVRINGRKSSTEVDITVVSKISQTTSTKRWAEGSWSGVRGYPSAITFFEERAVYGFTNSDQQTIWMSETDEFENFDAGTKNADSFAVRLPTADRGKWLGSLGTLAAGTAGGEWRVGSPLDGALTPSNFDIKEQTAYGSSDIQVLKVGSVILFVDFVGRKIREFTFREADQKYVSPDLTSLAEHITVSGIASVAHQKNPDSILWCVLNNGELVTLSYERDQNVVAWAKMPMDGLVQSVMVIPSTLEDEVWISIVRAVNGENKVYVEQFQPRILDIRKENAFFVDSGIIYQGPPTNTITGLGHLEGKIVNILADGIVLNEQRVVSGQVTLANQAFNVRVGLAYDSKLTPMRMDINTKSGTTHGSIKKTAEMVISFMNTVGAKYGKDDGNLFDIDFDRVGLKNTSEVEGLFTGDVTVAFDGGFDIEDSMVITQSDPLPCIVRAIVPRVEQTGR
jgi:hypothetical protein